MTNPARFSSEPIGLVIALSARSPSSGEPEMPLQAASKCVEAALRVNGRQGLGFDAFQWAA